ncbi:MAG: UPF0175 family protein [Planctomycetota bacterium]|jgi:predicted HTH domain antitoxin
MKTVPLSTRLDEAEAAEIDHFASEDGLERSAFLKQLIRKAFSEYRIKKAVERYRSGTITLSKAAELAKLSTYDLLALLPNEQLELNYNVEDLEIDLAPLPVARRKRKR